MTQDEIKKTEQDTIKLFDIYRSNTNRDEWAENVAEDIDFVNNAQWDPENAAALEANNMPAVCYNEIKPARDGVIQQLTNNNPQWLAVARENSDVELAGDVSDFGSYIWDHSHGNMKFIKATENFEDMGIFILHPYFDRYDDNGKGEIKIRCIDPRDWYPDPRSQERDAQDSENQFLAYVLSEGMVKRNFPDFNFEGAQTYKGDLRDLSSNRKDQGQAFDLEFLTSQNYYRIIDRWQKIKTDMYRIYDPTSQFEATLDDEELNQFAKKPALILNKPGEQRAIIKDSEVQKWINIINQEKTNTFHFMSNGMYMKGVEHQGAIVDNNGQLLYPIPGSTVQIEITFAGRLIKEGLIKFEINPVDRLKLIRLIGDKLYREVITPHSMYPFATAMLHHTGTPYAYGDARLAKPIQQQINKARSIITAYHINIASLKVFVPEGTDTEKLEKNWGKAGAQFFTYDPELGGIPIVMQFQQMANGLYEQIDRDKYLIQRLYGSYEYTEGAYQAPPQTKGGTILLDEFSQRRSKLKLQLIEEALNQLGYLIAEMIPKVYDEKKLIRITKPNQRSKELVFNDRTEENGESRIVNDLTANRYDLKMVSGSTLPTHRSARLDMALNLWDRQVLRDDETILRLTDLPNVDEIIQKNSLLAQAEQAVAQLQDMVKTLEGDAQTKDRELEHADRQIAKSKFQTKLAELQQTLKTGVNVAVQRMNDEVKKKKQEKKIES